MLKDNRRIMDKIAAKLIKQETITGKEFMKIYRKEKGIEEPKADKGSKEKKLPKTAAEAGYIREKEETGETPEETTQVRVTDNGGVRFEAVIGQEDFQKPIPEPESSFEDTDQQEDDDIIDVDVEETEEEEVKAPEAEENGEEAKTQDPQLQKAEQALSEGASLLDHLTDRMPDDDEDI